MSKVHLNTGNFNFLLNHYDIKAIKFAFKAYNGDDKM